MFYFVGMEDEQHPVIGFGLIYAGQLIYCEAVMQHNYYDVLFGGKWVATIARDDEWGWTQESGVILTDGIVAEIGSRIESNYE